LKFAFPSYLYTKEHTRTLLRTSSRFTSITINMASSSVATDFSSSAAPAASASFDANTDRAPATGTKQNWANMVEAAEAAGSDAGSAADTAASDDGFTPIISRANAADMRRKALEENFLRIIGLLQGLIDAHFDWVETLELKNMKFLVQVGFYAPSGSEFRNVCLAFVMTPATLEVIHYNNSVYGNRAMLLNNDGSVKSSPDTSKINSLSELLASSLLRASSADECAKALCALKCTSKGHASFITCENVAGAPPKPQQSSGHRTGHTRSSAKNWHAPPAVRTPVTGPASAYGGAGSFNAYAQCVETGLVESSKDISRMTEEEITEYLEKKREAKDDKKKLDLATILSLEAEALRLRALFKKNYGMSAPSK
jgi:hypothetical protein